MKVIDNGIKYMQIPVTIKGNYNPRNHDAAFSYNFMIYNAIITL